MEEISVMLKPASSACNLRCRYCFYADIAEKRQVACFGTMKEEMAEKILQNLRDSMSPGSTITIAFQGGEPTLAGLPWYQKFVEMSGEILKDYHVHYALQTNATKLDDRWAVFLRDHHFLLGISMDGPSRYHNACRPDAQGGETYKRVMQSVELLRKYQVEFNILCTLTGEIARHPNQVWEWILKNQFQYVQFTPCLDELGTPGASRYALQPQKFAPFYKRIFDLWLGELRQGRYRSIKLFDDVVNLLAFGVPTACGIHGRCQCQLVVESDGSAYPCDFYCVDRYRLGNLGETPVMDLIGSDTAKAFLSRPRDNMIACKGCRYQNFCGGGCRRMQREVYCCPGEEYCGYRDFLDYAMPALQQIAMDQRRYRR